MNDFTKEELEYLFRKFMLTNGDDFEHNLEAKLQRMLDNLLEVAEPLPRHKIFKQHWQAQLLEWFLGADIIYYLAFISGVIINGLLVSHSALTDGERIIEAVCISIVLTRIFKNERK